MMHRYGHRVIARLLAVVGAFGLASVKLVVGGLRVCDVVPAVADLISSFSHPCLIFAGGACISRCPYNVRQVNSKDDRK